MLEPSAAMRGAIAQAKAAEGRSWLPIQVRVIDGDMRRFKIDQHFENPIIAPLNTFLHNLTLDDQLATLKFDQATPAAGPFCWCSIASTQSAQAADDRRLILQRHVIDPETGEAAQLWLSRSADWGQQLQT
ncbi:MAG: hypothetical protein U0559_08575 [Anaerolineae bacterium]